MSRQAKAPRLEIVPDEISGPPGAAEAAEIRGLYATAQEGIRAFVLMGFRLIEVKARLPHGRYMAWLETNLGDLTHRHLHSSRRIAEGIVLRLGWSNWNRGSNLETLPAEVCDLIDGKGYRTLLMELREPLTGEAAKSEEECRVACEARWAKDAEERDEWEPRVLSGEINYHRALTGMLGQREVKGQAKPEPMAHERLLTAANLIQKHFEKWENISPTWKAKVIEHYEVAAAKMPEACRQAILKVWTKGGLL